MTPDLTPELTPDNTQQKIKTKDLVPLEECNKDMEGSGEGLGVYTLAVNPGLNGPSMLTEITEKHSDSSSNNFLHNFKKFSAKKTKKS